MQDFAQLEPLSIDTPQTRRGHERCLAFLLSANELFLEHGYDAVSLDDIVNHAGGSKASIYKYFGNKEGLFTAICDYRTDKFFKDICIAYQPEKDDLRDYLIQTLISFNTHLNKPENAAFMRLVLERTQRSSVLALYIHEQGPKHIQVSIADALELAAKNNLIQCENSLYSAQFFFGILRNLEWRVLMGITEPENAQETLNYVQYCVDRFLDGHQKR